MDPEVGQNLLVIVLTVAAGFAGKHHPVVDAVVALVVSEKVALQNAVEETEIVVAPVVVVVAVAGPDKSVVDDADKVVETVVANAAVVTGVVVVEPGGLLAGISFARSQNSQHNHKVEKVE